MFVCAADRSQHKQRTVNSLELLFYNHCDAQRICDSNLIGELPCEQDIEMMELATLILSL